MYFEQFYLSCLAHASYMLGSQGLAAVVDPQRDVESYIDEAARQNLRIAYVIESHLHADFVSGHNELARRTGAKILVGASANAAYPHTPLKDGDEIRFGRVLLRFLETPGHTPESMCVLVTDLDRSPDPWAVLTGDTLFIGDVGRPDLSPTHAPAQLAGMLFDSLHNKLLTLPDSVEVYPAHGAGSLCGRNISPERRSTIGKERQFNYALQSMSRDQFIHMLTADLPERPDYFSRDAEINRAGAPALKDLRPLPALFPAAVKRAQEEGVVVLDTRPSAQFGGGHVPSSVNIPLGGQFASWAGRILGLDERLILVAEDPAALAEARMRLARVGIERIVGSLDGGILAWQNVGLPLAETQQISVQQLNEFRGNGKDGEALVLDVRNPGEWNAGHIQNAVHLPLDQLGRRSLDPIASADRSRPVAVHCKSGYRSSIASSLLERAGFQQVMNVVGGFDAWQARKLPVVGADAPTSCSA